MAHVMKPVVGRLPGPYADNTYIPTTTHGWVHANTWYANAPFNSAPPPAPAGINPQTWASGQWKPNPYFRPPPNMTQPNTGFQMWAPHPGWGNNVAAGQNWNPYKRVPNPGDASYWATELSDNPLKLENMHIRDDTPAEERHRKDSSNGVPHTPWVWVPKELSSDATKPADSAGASGSRDGQNGQRQHEQSQKDLPQAPQPQRREHMYDHTRSNSLSRNAYASPPTAHESSSHGRPYHDAARSASTPQDRAPASAPATISTYSAYHQQQQQQRQQQQQPPQGYTATSQQTEAGQHQRQHSRNVSPRESFDSQPYSSSRDYRNAPTSAGATSSASAAAAAAAAYRQASADYTDSSGAVSSEREPRRGESYSVRQELHPTFSPKIVRTPDHYYTSSGRLAKHEDIERTPRHSSSNPTHGPIYAPATAPTRSNSLNNGRQSTPHPSSGPTPDSSLGLELMHLTDEPGSLLSPLIVPSTPPDSTRPSPRNEVGRSQTYPSVAFDYVPEERERPVYRKTPREFPRSISREPSDRERDRDRERERERRRDYSRSRDVDATPQPGARTPPAHTPPLSHYTRPSPEHRSTATPISRSHTYPAVIPPPPITPQRSRSPGRSPRYSPSHGPSQSYSSSSPYGANRTSPNPPTTSIANTSSPLRHNPLPRPPQQSPYVEQLARGGVSSSASAAAAAVAAQQQSTPRRQVRLGYWNRRGDHLHVNENGERRIVYAPRHLANPEDLKYYPSPTEGWRDHHGNHIRYDPNVPELQDSLPLHGEPPARPYQHFVQYVSV
ncbi:hypothetical protein VTO73DRAFT_6747 [Trametes versicolor]